MGRFDLIREKFEKESDFKKANEMSAYMKNQFYFYGIQTPKRRDIYKAFLKEEKKRRSIDWDFLEQAWHDNHRESQYLVLDYLSALNKYLTYNDIFKIEIFIRSKQWWDSIDILAKVIGQIGLVDDSVEELMLTWSKVDDFWVRRLAILHQLGRKDATNVTLLRNIILNNIDSKEFFINKAIGWALRDFSKTNPDWVRDFLAKYNDHLSNLTIREASKYL
ncbi:DNA alkylation repair protein [Streptococcus equinus]|uniref:DNA alkylation repair protein n=1 Tax=Streptococcus equinus TaxID=1335 RepID=UPI003BF910E6